MKASIIMHHKKCDCDKNKSVKEMESQFEKKSTILLIWIY